MKKKLLSCLVTGALAMTLALASPAFARGGGHGGGGHGGGGGGGTAAELVVAGTAAAWVAAGTAAACISPVGILPMQDSHGFFHHHHFHRFGFVGLSYGYDGCWRRAWTPYGLRWVNVCSDYNYY